MGGQIKIDLLGTTFNYVVKYIDHRRDEHLIGFTAFEDAERTAQFIANMYDKSILFDGYIERKYVKENE